MADDWKRYTSESIDVEFSPRRCIHAARCVDGLPAVFDTARRPWIQPGGAAADDVAATVVACPTGALRYTRRDDAEKPLDRNLGTLETDGPLYVRGQLDVGGERELRVALCRCGASSNKPYCDNSHGDAGYREPASCEAASIAEVGDGPLEVKAAPNGPLLAAGPLEIRDARGEVIFRGDRCALCRCGKSGNAPFCDGSHKAAGFVAE